MASLILSGSTSGSLKLSSPEVIAAYQAQLETNKLGTA